MSWLSGLFGQREGDARRLPREGEWVVALDEQQVSVSHPERGTESLAWSDLREVEIVTTEDGPWGCDWYWVLHGAESGLAIPQGATGEMALLERLQRLPGFDNESVLRAGSRPECRRVRCWQRDGGRT